MKPRTRTLLIPTLALITAFGLLVPHAAHAFSAASIAGEVLLFVPGFVAAKIIMPIMALLVYLTGMILNWSVHYSVVDMANQVKAAGIDQTWTVIRDLANMGFIFVLLYTALQTMFGFGDYKKTIKNMVIAALLINFSLLITKAIIDASNVLALLFYKAIAPGATDPTTGIASSFMNTLGLGSIYDLLTKGGINGTQMFVVGVGSSILELIASFTFLAVAAMFMIRFIVLVFVLALSPIYCLGMILPNVKGYAGQWASTLFGQAFFAPVYFMLTWVALKVAQGLFNPVTGGVGNISGAILGKTASNGTVAPDPSTIATIINYFIVIGLLVGALMAAKKLASKAPGFVNNITTGALGYAGKASFGVAGSLGRNTIGRAGAMIGDNEELKQRAAEGSIRARLTLAAGRKASEQSFDARGLGGLGKALGAGEINKNAKGGYKKLRDESAKAEAARVKSYMMDKDSQTFKDDVQGRKDAVVAAKTNLDTKTEEAKEAAKTAHPDVVKSKELLDAEANEIRARESINLAINPSQKEEFTNRYNAARDKVEELRNAHVAEQTKVEQSRTQYVAQETFDANKAHEDAKTRAESNINSDRAKLAEDDARKGNWRTRMVGANIPGTGDTILPTSKIPYFGKIFGNINLSEAIRKGANLTNEAKAAAIRKQSKEKPKKERARDLLEEADKEEKAKEAQEKGEVPAPAGSTPPTT